MENCIASSLWIQGQVRDGRIGGDREALRRLVGQDVDPGEFPIQFTSLHDLSIDYLLEQLVKEQRAIISICEQAVNDLAADAMSQAVAQEAIGNAKAHLDSLQELVS